MSLSNDDDRKPGAKIDPVGTERHRVEVIKPNTDRWPLYRLDLDLVASLAPKLGVNGSPEEILRHYRLVEVRNGRFVPCLAGLLLFGKDPLHWHLRCGIDFARWEGTERRTGAEFNIVKRFRIEHPLAVLPERAFAAIQPHIRERQQLHGLFFTEKLEYPTFVWQEAIINAIAHRDYSLQGASIEVWMFDDHIEIRSPGLPPQPVTIEALNRRERLHFSRNPLIVRMLADLGYMREAGEGIRRMFDEMEREGFYPPRFADIGGVFFEVTLRNQPVYDLATLEWLEHFKDFNLSGDQKRLLALARSQGGRFTSRDYQKLVGLDLYSASNSIKELIRKGIVRSTGKGSRVYKLVEPTARQPAVPVELSRLLPLLRQKGSIQNKDVCRTLGVKPKTATHLLDRFVMEGWLERVGQRRGTRYLLGQRPL
jgi:ATP-dependent DNA helicase RecG